MNYSENIKYDFIDSELFFEKIEKIKKHNSDKEGLKYTTLTYGCQMNANDSEKIAWILELMGYSKTDEIEEADFVIFNTCAIRENAELKVYGKVGSLKTIKEEHNPNLKIAICGCMMQIDSIRDTIENKFKHVDIIFGTNNIQKLPELFLQNLDTKKTAVDVVESSFNVVEGLENIRANDHSAYVNIMYGCNNFCTYCVVPYTRGREVSRRAEDVLDEVRKLAEEGYKEITLLGQNVNSYGKTLGNNYGFTDLLRDIDKIDGIKRIRFMTSHPRDISDELITAYGELDKLSNSLHLPVQSGSNNILKSMNRHYTREKYIESIKKLRQVSPDITLSTDIIIGFPGETEEDFLETMSLIKEVEYDFVYNFIYSVRPGTKAAHMEEQVPYEVKHDRFVRLNEVVNDIIIKKNREMIGSVVEVLVDGVSKTNDEILTSRTDEFKIVNFPGNKSLIGELVNIEITHASTFALEGKLV